MQTIALSRANDTLDPGLWHRLRALHAMGNNVTAALASVTPGHTALSRADIERMEAAEYPFSGTCLPAAEPPPETAKRETSATTFDGTRSVPPTLLEELLGRSFGASGSGAGRWLYPSGGALYAFQVGLRARNVAGLAPAAITTCRCSGGSNGWTARRRRRCRRHWGSAVRTARCRACATAPSLCSTVP